MSAYVEVPKYLDDKRFIEEFGLDAFFFYSDRISERMDSGKIYLNPIKTMYIWAKKDKDSRQGFYSNLYVRNRNRRKLKNHGRS